VPSVCPYCEVGCGQLVHVRDKRIINIEGNPDSPINQGTLCPKGAATYQLVVNDQRITKVWYRAPGATEWDKTRTLEWAMERVAQRVKETREESFQEIWQTRDAAGQPVTKWVNHTLRIGSLSGATCASRKTVVRSKSFEGDRYDEVLLACNEALCVGEYERAINSVDLQPWVGL
jgi:formate dehydrogenase major subunit